MRMLDINKVVIINCFITLILLCSCSDRPETIDKSLRVGNILLSDNTITSPEGYNKNTDTAVGVIFYQNGDTVIVVGVKELGQYIYSDSIGTIASVTNNSYSLCGTENTAAILSSSFQSPAVNAITQYPSPISGWALPSAGELKRLSQNLNQVKIAMKVIGGDDFKSGQYLSSSQDGTTSETQQLLYYGVSLQNGFVTSINKHVPNNVRPILRVR